MRWTPSGSPWLGGASLSEIEKRLDALADKAGVAALDRIERAYHELMNEDDYEGPGSPPCAPFCGCMTCMVREILDAAYPYLREAARLEIEQ